MSDIVERLRVRDFEDYNEICDKAANEIEWLMARLVEAEKQADVRLLQAQDWRARAERLEAALRPFAAYASASAYINCPTTPDHGAPANTPHSVGEYRRAALATGGERE